MDGVVSSDCEIPLVILKDEKLDRWSVSAFDRPLYGSYDPDATSPAGVNADGGVVNNIQDALCCRMEAANGRKAVRFIQAAMDYAVVGQQLQKNGEAEYDTINSSTSAPTLITARHQLKNFWDGVTKMRDFLVYYCCIVKKHAGPLSAEGLQTYVIDHEYAFTSMILRGSRTRAVGRGFDLPHARSAR